MKFSSDRTINYQEKIIALWTVFLLGTLFHTQLALMPLFHGLSVAESHTHEFVDLSFVMWFMAIVFTLPMIAIVATAFEYSKSYRIFHFGLTVLYTVSNFLHFVLDILVKVPSYQLFLMVFLIVIGILLNIVSFQWMGHRVSKMRLG